MKNQEKQTNNTNMDMVALMLNGIVIELNKKKRLSKSDKNILLSCKLACHNIMPLLQKEHIKALSSFYYKRAIELIENN